MTWRLADKLRQAFNAGTGAALTVADVIEALVWHGRSEEVKKQKLTYEKRPVKVGNPVVGIFAGDLHFSLEPPVARAVEEDWMAVQEGYVVQLANLQREHHMVPIFVAGDFGNKWNLPHLLVNSLIRWTRGMRIVTIPGNHDVPDHNYLQLPRSAYWTLVEAGSIEHLTPGGTHSFGNLIVSPFPWGFEVTPCNKADKHDLCLNVALVHQYVWTNLTKGNPKAAESERFGQRIKSLKGYDAAFFGDNHLGFQMKETNGCVVANCGTFMRRFVDEKDYRPRVYLLYEDGTVKPHFLDTSADRFSELDAEALRVAEALDVDLSDFAEALGKLEGKRWDFVEGVLRWLEGKELRPGVADFVRSAVAAAREVSNV